MILVTGGTGLVGEFIAYLMSESLRLKNTRNLSKFVNYRKNKSLLSFITIILFDAIEWVQGDIIDVPTLEHA
jgi:nucleoside-diphosphate-sugar epimerase